MKKAEKKLNKKTENLAEKTLLKKSVKKEKTISDGRSTEEVKNDLLKAALKHFALHGYQGASLSLIAQEAKVANSLINYYFKGKEGLFIEIIDRTQKIIQPMLKGLLDSPKSIEEVPLRLEFFVRGLLELLKNEPDTYEVLDREFRMGNPLVMPVFEKLVNQNFIEVVNFFKDCQKKGFLKKDLDPRLTASLLHSVICDTARSDGLIKHYFNKTIGDERYRDSVVQHILILFLNGVMA